MIEILEHTQATLDIVFSAGYADGTVTITITDANGTVVVNAANATKDLTATGRYTYNLAPQPQLAWLVATWSGTFAGVAQSISTGAGQNDGTPAEVQVCGGHLFTISQLRALGDAALSNSTTYPDETLIDARSRVTTLFEDFCGIAFVPRYGRCKLDGNWRQTVWLPNGRISALTSVTIDGTALTTDQLTLTAFYPSGQIYRWGWWPITYLPQNIVVEYEHGYPYTPQDLARAAMIQARYELGVTEFDQRATSHQTELGLTRIAQPDEDHPTGIPWVDATLLRYRKERLGGAI